MGELMSVKKFWLRSKTMIINMLFALLGVVPTVLPDIRSMSIEWYIGLSIAVPVVNMALRTITSEPITFKKQPR